MNLKEFMQHHMRPIPFEKSNESHGFCTKYVSTSINKHKCAINCRIVKWYLAERCKYKNVNINIYIYLVVTRRKKINNRKYNGSIYIVEWIKI